MGTTRTCPRCGGSFSGTLDLCPTDRTPLFEPEVLARVGMLLKDHEIQGVIGEGGMGVVYRAQHVVLEKPVAIKVLHERFARQTEAVEQFILEAKAASRIRHPNIIDVTDIGTTDDGLVFLVMEYLEGENLEERLRQVGRVSVFDAVNILGQVARGLGAAHELGIVHRDLKPANIFLQSRAGRRRVVRRTGEESGARYLVEPEGNFDFVKLLDFGVAKFLDMGPSAATRAGAICGTPYYLSPEQAQERPAEVRSDIYSLGAVFYEMITGGVPFFGESMLEILNGHVRGVVVPPSQRAPDAGIDPHTDAVVCKCLAKHPADRFSSADEFGDALHDCVGDRVFVRDADRLPGIREAGIELSGSDSSARRDASPSPEEARWDDGSMDPDGPAGRNEPRAEDELAGLDFLDSDGMSSTTRIDGVRTQRTRVLVGAAVVAASLAGLGVWYATKNRTPEPPSKPPVVAAIAPAVPPPAPPAAPPPAPLPAALAEANGHARSPALAPEPIPASAKPPSSRGAGRPRLSVEELARRMPSQFPSAPPIPTPPSEPVPQPPAPAPAAPVRPAGDPEALLREAQEAWMRKHYAMAVDKANSALELAPGERRAYQIIAVCSCSLHNIDEAKQAAAHLDPAKRKLVRSLCEKNGVMLDPD